MPETVDDLIGDFATHLQKCKAGIAPILHKPFDRRPPDAVMPRVVLPPTPEEIEADRKLQRRQREERRDIRAELQTEIDKKRGKARQTIEDEKRNARKKLADELRASRKKLSVLKRQIVQFEAEARFKAPRNYPDIPPAVIEPNKFGHGLPEAPGIYFLWLNGAVEYVGKSSRLANRLRLGTHHVLSPNHRISFLPFEARDLTWVECYYIGIARPQQNFGSSASHYTPSVEL